MSIIFVAALRYTSSEGDYKDSAARLTNHLVNVRYVTHTYSSL